MVGSSATLPRNREAMRIRVRARQQQSGVDPAFVRIAQALQPDEPAGASRAAVLTALGAVFGFAFSWLLLPWFDGWYALAALGMSAGALVGAVIGRLNQKSSG